MATLTTIDNGQIVSSINTIINSSKTFSNPDASDAERQAAAEDGTAALITLISIAQPQLQSMSGVSLAGLAGATLSAKRSADDLEKSLKEGNTEKAISDGLGLAAGLGGIIVAAPSASKELRGAGLALSLGATAAKQLYDSRKGYPPPLTYNEIKRKAPRRLGNVKSARLIYTDPLALDLDGDGIELTRLSGETSVKFDADGDGVRTATAWIASDDALLVLDRNGNGLIDDGSELFGDQTRLANGQLAADGIAALADLDSNCYGVFSALDARYDDVRLWQDRNQDGISQADELIRLADAGVASISLTATSPNTSLTDAVLEREGTWTATDGSTHQTGSFDFAQDSYWTAFDSITVSEAAKALPNIGGNGFVRDLREAATLNPKLIDLYAAVENATTRAEYQDAVGKLYREWAGSSAYQDASDQAKAHGSGYGLIASAPKDAQEAGWLDMAIMASEADRNAFRVTLSAADRTKFDAMRERMTAPLEAIFAYEAFTGTTLLHYGKL